MKTRTPKAHRSGSLGQSPKMKKLLMSAVVVSALAACRGQTSHDTPVFGIRNMYCGVPAKLGKKGIRSIVEIPLTDAERQALQSSADKVRKGVEELETLESRSVYSSRWLWV